MPKDGAELLEELMRFRPDGMTANAWAVRAGVSRTIWADLRRHGNPSRRTLSKLLEAAGSSLAEFEALRIGRLPPAERSPALLAEPGRGWGQASLSPLPVVWTAAGGQWDDDERDIDLMEIQRNRIVDRVPRPASLASDRDAYAITVVGESMWPRFRTGRLLAISPSSPVEVGNDVLLILAADRGALIGELHSRNSGTMTLRQFNPQGRFDIQLAAIDSTHRVLGELF
jgi:SOS-response transcriptional repressor LexA